MDSPESTISEWPRVQVSGLDFDALTEDEVVEVVRKRWTADQGGSIVTVNVDIARAAFRDSRLAELIIGGSLVVADGMPLVWAAKLQGTVLPQRVTGSSLIFSLSEAAASDRKSLYILGGAKGVPQKAAELLAARYAGLMIAGTLSPEFGFDRTEKGIHETVATVKNAAPDLVFVGLGFPRQEQLIESLRQELPNSWYLACGGGITMAAGLIPRAAPVMQRFGLEWLHRLGLEPKRLARRYLRDDLPFALMLLARAAAARRRHRRL